jgi:outer membrane cobalamin receptor
VIHASGSFDSGLFRLLSTAVAVLVIARALPAQSRACSTFAGDTSARASPEQWPTPLDRAITVHMRDTSLREALDRVAVVANVRVSYSAELLPLDRSVCVSADGVPVGTVLTRLLAGVDVVPVTGGGDQIVLTPRPATAQPMSPEMARSLGVLDRVVVTGSAIGVSEREVTVGLDVVSGQELARDNSSTLSTMLDSYVPGVWSWSQSPSNILASYASIRGASSFGLSYPKIYIDGIEVANPLLISRFAPNAIDRVEVIRGPQGSALYGTDAISGVINIITRHDGANGTGENGSIRTTAGVTQSAFSHNVLRQDHSLSVAAGTDTRSVDLNVSGGSIGDFVPNGYSKDLIANGGARFVGERTTVTTNARFFMEEAGSATNPLIARPTPPKDGGPFMTQSTSPQSVQEYTVGSTATLTPNDEWTHSLVAGIDGYKLANVQTNFTPIPSVADSALRAAQGGATRATLRASSVYHLLNGEASHATLTFSAEHATLRESSVSNQFVAENNHTSPARAESRTLVSWQNSTGVSTQANIAANNTLFLTSGLRVEHDSRLAGVNQFAVLPMLGAAAVRDYGPLTVKIRATFGKGIRPPSTLGHSEFWQTPYASTTQQTLAAEEQSGTEVGVDLLLRRALSLHVTRFDQRASGLIQQVAVPADPGLQSRRVTYWLENVGEISNRGWEIEGSTTISHLSASGTLSFVDSRVVKVANGYNGDLIAGSRMLQVPSKTGSVNLSWLGRRWFASLGGSRALDWINYDELALSNAFASGDHPARELLGAQLRQYWRRYDGGLRVRAAVSRDIRDKFAVELRADNLLNYQRDEPDNITIVPGRTIMTGVRVKF